jgi:hypothetical protein
MMLGNLILTYYYKFKKNFNKAGLFDYEDNLVDVIICLMLIVIRQHLVQIDHIKWRLQYSFDQI